jgi:predicted 3-demethylubiquinone-9 3-methyltransferase (glyoxalase superfamily)
MVAMMSDKDGAKAQRVAMAMMKMKKIIIADLEAAYNG